MTARTGQGFGFIWQNSRNSLAQSAGRIASSPARDPGQDQMFGRRIVQLVSLRAIRQGRSESSSLSSLQERARSQLGSGQVLRQLRLKLAWPVTHSRAWSGKCDRDARQLRAPCHSRRHPAFRSRTRRPCSVPRCPCRTAPPECRPPVQPTAGRRLRRRRPPARTARHSRRDATMTAVIGSRKRIRRTAPSPPRHLPSPPEPRRMENPSSRTG